MMCHHPLCSVWNPENIREREKNAKENDTHVRSTMENIKENQILHIFKFLSPYMIKRNE